jgi:hypothetical protein
MKGNALALAGKLMKFHSEVPLINAIREKDEYTLEALKEALIGIRNSVAWRGSLTQLLR